MKAIASGYSVKVFEYVPAFNGNPWPSKHLVPMLRFIGTTSAAYHNPANQFIGSDVVVVHHRDGQSGPSNSLARNIKHKGLVEARIGCSLLRLRLLFFHLLTLVQQPDLHIWV